eukprot:TRINITY_DN29507_c0_g1_i1.p1 TRINITY_DN29507_c0_g1~~TRINITY_DN29507_c0_g1_i1.p1  ORF type:complete len:387 (-),score=44.06 TRINITY_DN29507_c0_g1_i1:238-1398(-)
MEWLRGALSCVPVVGAAADALESYKCGDHVGVALNLGSLALDVYTAGGARSTLRAPLRILTNSKLPTTRQAVRGAATRLSRVAKATLKKKAKHRVREAAAKLGLAFAAAASEADLTRPLRRRLHDSACRQNLRKCKHSLQQYLGALSGALHSHPARRACSLPSLREQHFESAADQDAQLHAVLANQAYRLPSDRRGLLVPARVPEGEQVWYTYLGGDMYRGFWYCPNDDGHLVLAERGTLSDDSNDLCRDAMITLGVTSSAVGSRARSSMHELRQMIRCHTSARVTATGHSLGGTVAAFLLRYASSKVSIDAVHVFNPGGVPDLHRYLTATLSDMASSSLHVHRIKGDVVSVGFLPFAQRRYSRKPHDKTVDPHRMLHFLPSWCDP